MDAESGAALIETAEQYLREHVAPQANQIDADEQALRRALQGLCDNGLMALRRPEEYGGPAVDEPTFRHFQETVARYSGSLAFLQTQHQSAVRMISQSDNEVLKSTVLPLVHGPRLIGIGFSQLRRPGDPLLKAEPVEGGYRLTGTVPWVTGHSFFHDFLIGASLPDGSAIFGIVPFTDSTRAGGRISFEGPMRLAAMESPRTMSAELEKWLLTEHEVAFIKPPGWIEGNDMINVTLQAWFALGCARAGLDILHRAFEKRKASFLLTAWEQLDTELATCREAASDQSVPVEERLRARAWAIDLAARCAHAGVAASSGAANSIHHDAQRVYREALVYTVSAQTSEIMEATLQRLVDRGGRI